MTITIDICLSIYVSINGVKLDSQSKDQKFDLKSREFINAAWISSAFIRCGYSMYIHFDCDCPSSCAPSSPGPSDAAAPA